MSGVKAGQLEELGLDEPEPGLCSDTPENRRRIYRLEGGWQYERVLDEDGAPTGLLRPLNPETLTERRSKNKDYYKHLLVDEHNAWSDYVDAESFPLDAVAPDWVLDRYQEWRRREREGLPPPETPFPVRCEARRRDGTRCWNWASNPSKARYCRPHLKQGAKDAASYVRLSQIRLQEMSIDAVDNLEFLAFNAESDPVRLKASTEILDRAGVRTGQDINITADVTHHDSAEEVQNRILTLAERLTKKQELEAEAGEQALPQITQGEVVKETREP